MISWNISKLAGEVQYPWNGRALITQSSPPLTSLQITEQPKLSWQRDIAWHLPSLSGSPVSHASPAPSPSLSSWSGFGWLTQLSHASPIPSPSESDWSRFFTNWQLSWKQRSKLNDRRGGLMVSALDSGSTGPASRRGQVIVLCSWARNFTLAVPLSNQKYQWVPANCPGNLTKCWWGNLRWTNIPSRGWGGGGGSNIPSRLVPPKPG